MARKLDHSKGGFYEPDPARVQRRHDFVEPDDDFFNDKRKLRRSVWAEAIKMFRRTKIREENVTITQQELLTSLGFTKKEMRSKGRGRILKKLVTEGILLNDGTPNLDNKKVIEIISQT